MRNVKKPIEGIAIVLVFLISTLSMAAFMPFAQAASSSSSLPEISIPQEATMVYTPGMPVWNGYASNNFVGFVDYPLMVYNGITGTLLPLLAQKIVDYPSNNSFIVDLTPGLYWYNGSATMPFTAWDVYTEFYIGQKVFNWFTPYLSPSNITVINNTAIMFTLTTFSPTLPILMIEGATIWTPYSVWKPLLENVTALNSTAAAAYANHVESFAPPEWALGPYYATISNPYLIDHLEPQNLLDGWAKILPYHTWQYYSPEVEYVWTGSSYMNMFMAGELAWGQAELTPAQVKEVQPVGYWTPLLPTFSGLGLIINPSAYPLNITKVRLALAYAMNDSETVSAWNAEGIDEYTPSNSLIGFMQMVYPSWYTKYITNVSYNTAKAASLLESVGFALKNGEWYMPNGKQFTLQIWVSNSWMDGQTLASAAAAELTKFGIQTTVYTQDYDTLFTTTIPDGQFQLAVSFMAGSGQEGFASAWLMGNWWSGLVYTSKGGWNATADFPITWPNGTITQYNQSAWYAQLMKAKPLSALYNETMEEFALFYGQYVPMIPLGAKTEVMEIWPQDFNLTWTKKYGPLFEDSVIFPGIASYENAEYYDTIYGITPPGIQSPLADAIANHDLSPVWANFLSLPSIYSSNYVKSALSTSSVSLAVSPTMVKAGTPVTLSAKVAFANGTPASGVSVNFMSNGVTVGTATTGSSGVATYSYTPSAVGNFSITASLTQASSVVSPATTLTVEPSVTVSTVTLSSSASSVTVGSPVTLTATAKYSNGSAASGYAVAFYANGSEVGTATTGSNGEATYTYTPSQTGTISLVAKLVSAPSVASSAVSLTVTAKSTTNYAMYAIIAVVIIVIIVVVVVALMRRGSKPAPSGGKTETSAK
ncbi:ABC transporter substrate-binding protein [Tardisphaera saccharovorans]